MSKYVVVIEFLLTPNGAIFYMVHVFLIAPIATLQTETYQLSVSAASPEEAFAQAKEWIWLCLA